MPIDWEEVISQPRCVYLPPWQRQVRDTAADLRDLYAEVQIRPLRSVVILEAKDDGETQYIRIPRPPLPGQTIEAAPTIPLATCVQCDAIGLVGHFCNEPECIDSGAIFADPLPPARTCAINQAELEARDSA